MVKLKFLISAVAFATVASCGVDRGVNVVESPDLQMKTAIEVTDCGAVSYSVQFHDKEIIAPSLLGLIVDGDTLSGNMKIVDVSPIESIDETWEMPWGQNKLIVDRHNRLKISLIHEVSGRVLDVEFRQFDDAVAFRYLLPQVADSVVIVDELTGFAIAEDPEIWWSAGDYNTYEKAFNHTKIDSAKWIATPAIMRRNDNMHIALGEATILNYPDMTLRNVGDNTFKVDLTPLHDGAKAVVNAPFVTPWRTINIADDAAGIIEASTALNLSPKQEIGDVSTFKPMTYIGVWWEFHLGTKTWREGERQGATTESAMRYIDFAADHNIGGVVVEGWNTGWNTWGTQNDFDYITSAKNYDLRKVAAYAKERGVRLIMHHETGADVVRYEAMMERAFALCKELGITDVKTGHAGRVTINEHHHSQPMVNHFTNIAKCAANYSIALDMHEPIKASGIERTYPNLMTREGVRGMEWEAWSEGNPPSHTVLIPFTRGLSGPTDYTPGIFDVLYKDVKGERVAWNSLTKDLDSHRVHSTLAHQLSLMITIYSPWVMAADRIEAYDGHPAFEFVENLNPDYDETKVLDAKVGEYIATARRSGDVWYLGATTNEEGRILTLPLDFLGGEAAQYQATIYCDGDDADWVTNPTDYKIEKRYVTSADSLELVLANGGGAAVIFTLNN